MDSVKDLAGKAKRGTASAAEKAQETATSLARKAQETRPRPGTRSLRVPRAMRPRLSLRGALGPAGAARCPRASQAGLTKDRVDLGALHSAGFGEVDSSTKDQPTEADWPECDVGHSFPQLE